MNEYNEGVVELLLIVLVVGVVAWALLEIMS